MTRCVVLSLAVLAAAGCGGGQSQPPAPSDPTATLAQFMDAVKRTDYETMGRLWGTAEGSAARSLGPEELRQRVTVIQKYLDHQQYRVIGSTASGGAGTRQAYQVEIKRANGCMAEFPIELVQTPRGEWLVENVHLDQAGNPARPCTSRG